MDKLISSFNQLTEKLLCNNEETQMQLLHDSPDKENINDCDDYAQQVTVDLTQEYKDDAELLNIFQQAVLMRIRNANKIVGFTNIRQFKQ
ncbi:hypothetical protein ACE1AT_19845 [Pelatocladus sp. BLCC-F211]|uniref:hypothetical protein n=1 Tax=Pelatocladus sp. BLCC-F211 TaxID=3342752 RepID=UPI0035B9ACAA